MWKWLKKFAENVDAASAWEVKDHDRHFQYEENRVTGQRRAVQIYRSPVYPAANGFLRVGDLIVCYQKGPSHVIPVTRHIVKFLK
jgi:hypothetical protein